MAEAQLFPNRPIKRQREGCAAEPPFNAHVRRDYFGYYPTCWNKFPEGWACPCPNPELPNSAVSFRDRPREPLPATVPPGSEPGGQDRESAMPGDPAAPAEEGAPPLPDEGRQPFRMDGRPDPGRRPAPDPATPAAPDPSIPPRASLTPPAADRPSESVGLLEMPSLPSASPSQVTRTNLEPGAMSLAPEVARAASPAPLNRELGPLPLASPPNPSVASDSEPALGASAPAQAPRRRSVLGGLFNPGNKTRR